jgi:hypothetical protein
MKTDDLIALLSTGLEPVQTGAARQRLQWAVLGGLAGGLLVMLALYGLRKDIGAAALLPMFWFKLAFPLAVALPALVLTARLGHPGRRAGRMWLALPLPWVALSALALLALFDAAPEARAGLVLGSTWASCAFNIALVSLPGFVGLLWALKGLAPTRPALAGACAGLVAASLGTMVYALHCTEMQAPFLAVWYALGMLLPTAAGALLGPKLLRW